MPEDWDGITRDPDEVLYEISMKEDQMLYEEFVQRLNFNKKKVSSLKKTFITAFNAEGCITNARNI